ncbi:MAG: ATP-binding protein [Candidatus Heimdallarchaeota archaeon]|nr:ATP-binding protein [Candidatus Heimdallarchaeota archaeon]
MSKKINNIKHNQWLIIVIILNLIFISIIYLNQNQLNIEQTHFNQVNTDIHQIENSIFNIIQEQDQKYQTQLTQNRINFEVNHNITYYGSKEKNIRELKIDECIVIWEQITETWDSIKIDIIELENIALPITNVPENILHKISHILELQDEFIITFMHFSTHRFQIIYFIHILANSIVFLFVIINYKRNQILRAKNKELEKAYQISIEDEAKYRNLFNVTNDGIIVCDGDGSIVNYNTKIAKLLDYSDEEFDQISVFNICKDNPSKIQDIIKKTLVSQQSYGFDTILITKADTTVPVHINLINIIEFNKPYVYMIVNDLSERKEIEYKNLELTQQLYTKQKRETLGQFAGEISHEINNLLNVIFNYVELIESNSNNPELTKQNLNELRKIISNYSSISTRLLKLSKNEEISKTQVNLKEELENSCAIMQKIIPKRITLTCHYPKDQPQVMMDKGLFNQIILNLIGNSLDAIPNQGKVDIYLEDLTEPVLALFESKNLFESKPWSLLRIVDNGSGMSEEIQKQLFKTSFTTKETGTGLGLSIVRNIVVSCGGEITCTSKINEGTSFYIAIPRIA